jgi:hypothetical protein
MHASFTTASPYTSQADKHEEIFIPVQNLLLRNLHMNSKAYQNNKVSKALTSEDEDEEMWEEEEEVVAERYAEMNKILGSRKIRMQ